MIITEAQVSSYLNPLTLTKDFVYLCMESYVNTYDSKYLNILIDDYTLQEAYDTEWAKADALGDQTRDTNDATADTNKEIKMLRAMLRAAINKPKEYIQDKIKWLKKWMEDHFSEKHMEKMKDSAKDLWAKVRKKAEYVIERLKEKLSGKDKDTDQFDFTESNFFLNLDEFIDDYSILQEDEFKYNTFPEEDIYKSSKYGIYSYAGSDSYLSPAYVDDEKTQRLISDRPGMKNKAMQIAMGTPEDKYVGDVKHVIIDKSPGPKNGPMLRLDNKERDALEKKLEALHQEADKVNHPKSWFAKKIAWLRGLYTNLLHRMDKIAHTKLKNKTTMGVIKKGLAAMASSVMHLIDRFMNKLQLMSD